MLEFVLHITNELRLSPKRTLERSFRSDICRSYSQIYVLPMSSGTVYDHSCQTNLWDY